MKLDRWLMDSTPPWKAGLAVAATVMVIGGLLALVLPEWIASSSVAPRAADARVAWIDSMRTGVLGVIALGAIAAWIIQYRQAVMERTVDVYNDRVRQLSQDTWQKVASIRDLEQISATNSAEVCRKTLQMLAVFVRECAPRTESLDGVSTDKPTKTGPRGKPRPNPAVQEALRVIGRHLDDWAPQPHQTSEDHDDAVEDARRAGGDQLEDGTGLADEPLRANYVSLADIAIDGAVLRGGHLTGLNLRRSLMRGVKFEGANMSRTKLRSAVLSDADLEGVILSGASLVKAKLIRANLRGADLRFADLSDADLAEANLEGAHLRGANGLSAAQLRRINGVPHCQSDDVACSGVLSARATTQPSVPPDGTRTDG